MEGVGAAEARTVVDSRVQGAWQAGQRPSEEEPLSHWEECKQGCVCECLGLRTSEMCSRQKMVPQQEVRQGTTDISKLFGNGFRRDL